MKKRKKRNKKKYHGPKLPILIDFARWKLIDLYRTIKNGRDLHLYGIHCYIGIYGGGKTVSLVDYLEQMRDKYGDKIYISTNFGYTSEDFPITKWQDLLKNYDRPVIYGYDELQNEFSSRGYRDFPVALMGLLTQNRKGFGKQIVYTTQNYGFVDKSFRELTTHVVTCRTLFGRLTHCRKYIREMYEQQFNQTSVDRRIKSRPVSHRWFVQSDELRSRFDSFKMLDSAKAKQYIGLDEMSKSS